MNCVKWFCFEFKWNEVKWVTVKFLGTKVPCKLGLPYTVGTWLYCDYFIWCVSCSVAVLTCFVICVCVCVCCMCGCFDNCVSVLVICVLVCIVFCIVCIVLCIVCTVFFVLFRWCIFILICFVCTGVRTTATGWKLNCSK